MPDFRLPDLGEGVTEAEIDRWLVKEGDVIEEDAPLVDVITDKASAEIPSPFEGVVARIHVKEGEVVAVGTTLVTIGEDASASSAPPPPPPVETASAPPMSAGISQADSPTGAAAQGNGSGIAVKAMPPVRK